MCTRQVDDEIVRLYAAAITPRTRLPMVCRLADVTGQILPVRAVRVTPHVFTTTAGLDALVRAIRELAAA